MLEEFVRAIRRGDADDVRRLLQQGVNVNAQWRAGFDHGPYLEGVTPLMVAAAAPESNLEVVQILLDAGANVKEVSDGGVTAAWYAAGGGTGFPLTEKNLSELDADHPYLNWGGGDVDRLRAILDAGGNVKDSAANGRTTVSEACSAGDPERLRLLIERGATVRPAKPKSFRMPSIQETTIGLLTGGKFSFIPIPLFEAAKSGSLACVELIVEAGFPADFESDKKTALDHAGNAEITEYLLQAGLKTKPGPFGFDAIDNAFDDENYAVAEKLLEAIPAQDKKRVLQAKLMMSSGLRMSPTAIRMLIGIGADVTLPDADFGSALHTACWQGDGNGGRENRIVDETVNMLIDGGADLELWNKRGETPLFEAVEGDWASPSSVRVLVLRGANVNATNQQAQTPLMIAARTGALECVQLLLAAGADSSMMDSSHKTALDYANENARYWSARGIKLPMASRIVNKLLGVNLKLDDQKIVNETEEIIRLLEAK